MEQNGNFGNNPLQQESKDFVNANTSNQDVHPSVAAGSASSQTNSSESLPNNQHPTPTQPSKESLWYVDNYILLKDYYDRTISRIAARCVRMGNIAMEEYPFYGYILDVLEEISDTGDYILQHKELYPYVEKKIAGGITNLKKSLDEYQEELRNNSSPDMIKEDASEIEKMKEALGAVATVADDPTVGAGMNMDQLMDKLLAEDQAKKELKKVIKIKKPVNAETGVLAPQKDESADVK